MGITLIFVSLLKVKKLKNCVLYLVLYAVLYLQERALAKDRTQTDSGKLVEYTKALSEYC